MLGLEDLLEAGGTDGVAAARKDLGKAIVGVVAVETDGTIKEFGLHWI